MTQHWVNPVNATSDAWGYELSPRGRAVLARLDAGGPAAP